MIWRGTKWLALLFLWLRRLSQLISILITTFSKVIPLKATNGDGEKVNSKTRSTFFFFKANVYFPTLKWGNTELKCDDFIDPSLPPSIAPSICAITPLPSIRIAPCSGKKICLGITHIILKRHSVPCKLFYIRKFT